MSEEYHPGYETETFHTKGGIYLYNRHHVRDFLTELNRIRQKQGQCKILDICCGNAKFLEELIQNGFTEVWGLDRGREGKKYAHELPEERYILGNANKLKEIFEGKKFDAIITTRGIQYTPDPIKIIEQAYTLLSQNGELFASPFKFLINEKPLKECEINASVPIDLRLNQNGFYSIHIVRNQDCLDFQLRLDKTNPHRYSRK